MLVVHVLPILMYHQVIIIVVSIKISLSVGRCKLFIIVDHDCESVFINHYKPTAMINNLHDHWMNIYSTIAIVIISRNHQSSDVIIHLHQSFSSIIINESIWPLSIVNHDKSHNKSLLIISVNHE